MNGTHVMTAEHAGDESHAKVVAGGSLMEAFGALATIALAIVGLANIWPMTMAAIAAIVVGAALLIEGGGLGFWANQRQAGGGITAGAIEETTSVNVLGGMAAVVLGILALLGVDASTLVAISVLALGATFVFSGRIFVGMAGVVLGILAVCHLVPQTLYLVAFLVLGAGLLLSGSRRATRAIATS